MRAANAGVGIGMRAAGDERTPGIISRRPVVADIRPALIVPQSTAVVRMDRGLVRHLRLYPSSAVGSEAMIEWSFRSMVSLTMTNERF